MGCQMYSPDLPIMDRCDPGKIVSCIVQILIYHKSMDINFSRGAVKSHWKCNFLVQWEKKENSILLFVLFQRYAKIPAWTHTKTCRYYFIMRDRSWCLFLFVYTYTFSIISGNYMGYKRRQMGIKTMMRSVHAHIHKRFSWYLMKNIYTFFVIIIIYIVMSIGWQILIYCVAWHISFGWLRQKLKKKQQTCHIK